MTRHSFEPTGTRAYQVTVDDALGDGDVRCPRCGVNLPAKGGEVLDGWRGYVDRDCDEELILSVLEV